MLIESARREEPRGPAGNSGHRAGCEPTRGLAIAVALVLGVLPGAAVFAAANPVRHAPPGLDRTGVEGRPAFVSDEDCVGCHAQQADLFRASDHDLAMQEATAESVLGDFDDASFEHFGVKSVFSRRDGRFFVRTEGPKGDPAEYEIAYTFGVDPLQQYLVHFPGGRLQALPIAWDSRRGQWFHLHPDERIAPDDPLYWTGRYGNWNAMCAECHSTNLRKRYDPDGDGYRTTWSAIDVGCQACHGPGERHIAWALADEKAVASPPGHGLVVDFGDLGARGEVDACARCHSRRRRISAEDAHGRPFLDDFQPVTLDPLLYYPDGQIEDEVYVYGSFLQSKMYAAGVRCSDCHDPHSLSLRAEGNALCTRCHQPEPDRRFAGLRAGSYDTREHHHHEPGSEASLCVTCHMPARTYMVVDPRRDHSLRPPRPDLSQTLGVPNACNGCHADRSPEWASTTIDTWSGAQGARPANSAAAIHDGRAGDPAAFDELVLLARSDSAPGIVRATAISLLPSYGPPALPVLEQAARDSDPLVRSLAARGYALLPPTERAARLAPLLDDPIRSVRMEAAAQLAMMTGSASTDPGLAKLPSALAEYEASQIAVSDLPGGRLNLGVLYTAQGRLPEAEAAYRAAIAMDADFLPAYANLSQLLDATGRSADAEAVLREGIRHVAQTAELHYSLGLLLAQQGRLSESVSELRLAVRGLPDRARIHYNLGLAEQTLGHADRAETSLSRAAALDPREPAYANALAMFYAQQGDFARAVEHARRLVELMPESHEARSLLTNLERERTRVPYPGANP